MFFRKLWVNFACYPTIKIVGSVFPHKFYKKQKNQNKKARNIFDAFNLIFHLFRLGFGRQVPKNCHRTINYRLFYTNHCKCPPKDGFFVGVFKFALGFIKCLAFVACGKPLCIKASHKFSGGFIAHFKKAHY